MRLLGWPATILHGDPTVFDRWRWLSKNLEPGNKRTLDAGCGTGAFTLYAARIGNEALGISFNERNMKVAEERSKLIGVKNAQFIQGDLRELDSLTSKIGTFDQILCFETIEHLVDDQRLVDNLAHCLRPGGILLLTTPFKGHVPVEGESKDPNYFSPIEDGGHVRYGYTQEELQTLIVKSGLRIEKFEYVSGYISQQLYNLWCHLDRVLPHKMTWGITLPLRSLQAFDSLVSSLFKYPRLSIAVVARKP